MKALQNEDCMPKSMWVYLLVCIFTNVAVTAFESNCATRIVFYVKYRIVFIVNFVQLEYRSEESYKGKIDRCIGYSRLTGGIILV